MQEVTIRLNGGELFVQGHFTEGVYSDPDETGFTSTLIEPEFVIEEIFTYDREGNEQDVYCQLSAKEHYQIESLAIEQLS